MKRILIVDDQSGIRLLLEEVFKRDGYETTVAKNGYEAIERFKDTPPDCVLLDMKMPGMDGIEVLREFKSQRPDIPVFMMTAYGEQEQINAARGLGAEKYFTKPFDIHELRSEIGGILA